MKNLEKRKKITVILEDSLVEKIEYAMNILKIRTYNSVLCSCLTKGYSIDQIFEHAKEFRDKKVDVLNPENKRIEMYN